MQVLKFRIFANKTDGSFQAARISGDVTVPQKRFG